ncbi:MAG: hypothetical protein ACTHM1_04870 [Solirubrobacteraceae bacterium]
MFSLTAFLLVLAVLGTQLKGTSSRPRRPLVVLRRIYRTTVVERVLPAGQTGPTAGASVTQSVSGSGSAPMSAAAPVTRAS